MKWKTKPQIKEAEQFGGFYATPYPPGVEMEDNSNNPNSGRERYAFYVTTTHNQRVYIENGDFIVKEPNGNGYYPCKPDIWLAGHELIVEPMPRPDGFPENEHWPPL